MRQHGPEETTELLSMVKDRGYVPVVVDARRSFPHGEIAAQLRLTVVPLARLLRQQTGGLLTATQGSVLGTVARHGPLSLSDLAAREQLSAPMISKVVTALEGHDLIARRSHPDDGRVWLVEISAHGSDWLVESRERRDRWLADRLSTLDDDAVAAIRAALPALGLLAEGPP